ncbi:hypothetical protein U8V72_14340 [Priestia filamentosa]|uniref:hypothetical protein n=1 Tax=Priestia filamentosa TaxID=1402861 RepID=UPI0005890386
MLETSKENLIKVTKKEWDKIPKDYKGFWNVSALNPNIPKEYLGRRRVMSGSIGAKRGSLLTEGIHFEIVE